MSVHSPLMNLYAHFSAEAQVSVRLFFILSLITFKQPAPAHLLLSRTLASYILIRPSIASTSHIPFRLVPHTHRSLRPTTTGHRSCKSDAHRGAPRGVETSTVRECKERNIRGQGVRGGSELRGCRPREGGVMSAVVSRSRIIGGRLRWRGRECGRWRAERTTKKGWGLS